MQKAITILGWVMIALSPVPWLAIIAVPFLDMEWGTAALTVVVLLLAAETLFFAGAAIVAPKLLRDRRKFFDRLFGKRDDAGP